MFLPIKNIHRRLERLPMRGVLAGVVVGILVADRLRPELWVATVGFVIALGVAYYRRWALVGLIFMAGALSITLRRAGEVVPEAQQLAEIELLSVAHEYADRLDFDARVVALHDGEEWQRKAMDVRVMIPAEVRATAGERLVAQCRLRRYDEQTSYGGYMLRVGVVGRIYLDSTQILQREDAGRRWGERLRRKAMQRIESLGLRGDNEAVVAAMSVGERSLISRSLRQSYVRSGGAHLLAVSGLHVGFLFVIANLLLLPLVALRHGQLWRSVATVAVIWFYAMMAGFSPSVVRAAMMFTLVQMATNLANRNDHLNTLCVAALMMLLWDARMVYDAGFLLSVFAVVAIVEWGVPLCGVFNSMLGAIERYSLWSRWLRRCVNWLVSTIVVSFVASIATMPLTSCLFGEVSLWSVVIGGVMVALCAMVVSVTIIWTLLPIALFRPVASGLIDLLAGAMNGVAQWCADSTLMSYQIEISSTSCLLLYVAFALFTLALWSLPGREKEV